MANQSSVFPRMDIPESQKGENWYKEALDCAQKTLINQSYRIAKMNRMYDSYNGKTEADSIRYLVSTYGKKNRAKYVPYRLSKTKLDILVGEFLKAPLNATVRTINSDAVSAKTKKYELMLGAMEAKDEIMKLKSVGVDVMEGAEIPDKGDPTAFSKLSFKDKNESIMQIMLKEFTKSLDLHGKFSHNVQDCTLTSRAFGRIVVNELTGDMNYERIDPRDMIYLELDGDPYLEKTPYMGCIKKVPIQNILTSYRLTEAQRNGLDIIRKNPASYISDPVYRGRYSYQNGELCADVLHLEWKGCSPKYSKLSPKTNNQLSFDDSNDYYKMDLDAAEYEGNKSHYDKQVEKGDIKEIVTEWVEQMYEGTLIGHDMYLNMRKKPFVTRDEDTGRILNYSYFGMVFNNVDGETISLKEVCENFDNVFDILMYQILKEINKAKGKVIIYDRAGLPKKTTIKNVLYNALNDSFIDYDSSAAGNMSGNNLQMNQVFKEIDLGVSNSFQHLIAMKNDVMQTLDTLTGINQYRVGNIAASSTVANAQASSDASRTITEPMFYYLTKFCENVMNGILETGKLVWGLYQPEKARMILGDEKYSFLTVTRDIAFAAYHTELVNPRWEQEIRDRMRAYGEFSLNAKELRPVDMLDFEMAETLAEAKQILRNAWNEIETMRQKTAQMQMQADAENKDKAINAQMQINKENRDENLQGEKEKIVLKGKVDIAKETVKQKGKATLDQLNFENQQAAGEEL